VIEDANPDLVGSGLSGKREAFMRFGSVLAAAVLVWPVAGWATDLRIAHVTIVSPERKAPLRDASVTLRDGRIAAITTGALPKDGVAALDGRGLYLTPGLIDSHVHLSDIPGMTEALEAKHPDIAKAAWAQMPKSFLLQGYTTLVDLFSTPRNMARWKSAPLVPDTFFCGGAVLMGGYPMDVLPKSARYQIPYMLIEPDQTPPPGIDAKDHRPAAVVARMKKDGAICVKTTYERGFARDRNLPVPKLETIRELVRAAHAQGLPVMLHANGLEAQQFGVAAGVDVIVHGMWNVPPGSEAQVRRTLDGVVDKQIGWQATIQVMRSFQDMYTPSFLSDPLLREVQPASLIAWYGTAQGQWFHDEIAEKTPDAQMVKGFEIPVARAKSALNYLASHGGRLLFGTDTPSGPTYANPPGLNAWLEMNNYVAAGVTPAQVFQAATLSNAKALKLDREIGTVEVGKRANLLLLRQDPTKTIQAYRGIEKVILGGQVLNPAELAANR
jgi:imidazolonepropionase-like amidohydrolase